MNKPAKIYDIEYLKHEELTEDDLHNLFDTASFNLSLVLYMFKLINSKLSDKNITKLVTTKRNWQDKFTLTATQYNTLKTDIIQVYKNLYQYKDIAAVQKAEWWLIYYGFPIKK